MEFLTCLQELFDMSLFKNRSGGSLYRFKALEGYQKFLYEKYFMSDSPDQPVEPPTGEFQNRMVASYAINGETNEIKEA